MDYHHHGFRKADWIRDWACRIWRPPCLKGAISFLLAKGSNLLGYQRNLKIRLFNFLRVHRVFSQLRVAESSVSEKSFCNCGCILGQKDCIVCILLKVEMNRSYCWAVRKRNIRDFKGQHIGDYGKYQHAEWASLSDAARDCDSLRETVCSLNESEGAAWMLRRMVSIDLPGIPHCWVSRIKFVTRG
ncbi:unnamed protein product, partial [Clavelina lepadiformis]